LDTLVGRELYVLSNSVDKTDTSNNIYYTDGILNVNVTSNRVWVAGGESVYNYFVKNDLYDNLFVTRFAEVFEDADKHFPYCQAIEGLLCIANNKLEGEQYPDGSRLEIWA
jgi:dihydrofolate reductase